LLSELLRAGEWLRARPEHRDAELEHELSEYRKQVERLRSLLPFIHRALLRERARLEQERERVQAAAEWARGSRQTL
jgi:predicted  nucleic acid-binding Zn-ribbon protein